MTRFLAFASVLVVLAVYAPNYVPGVLSTFGGSSGEEERVVRTERISVTGPTQETIAPRKVALAADRRGHFSATILVNGRQIEMMVDTGASAVAINEATARRLGINPPRRAYTEMISTANGMSSAAPVMLTEVRIGGIRLNDVQALIVPGKALPFNLLGMTFLSRLSSFQVTRDRLVMVE